MIRLFTGINGTGKTLRVVDQLYKRLNEEADKPIEEQTEVYTNITGLKIENVHPLPESLDWRDTPSRSLVIYDEPQLFKPFKKGTHPSDIVEALTIHRKTEHEIWFVCPKPKMINDFILDLVHIHEHLVRPLGQKLATVYRYQGAERRCDTKAGKDRGLQSVFKYPKNMFDLYESAEGHDAHNKKEIPAQFFIYIAILIGIGYFAYTNFMSADSQAVLNATDTVASSPTVESAPKTEDGFIQQSKNLLNGNISVDSGFSSSPDIQVDLKALEIKRLREKLLPRTIREYSLSEDIRPAILMSDNKSDCRAYNTYGERLNIPLKECQFLIANPSYIPKPRPKNS